MKRLSPEQRVALDWIICKKMPADTAPSFFQRLVAWWKS